MASAFKRERLADLRKRRRLSYADMARVCGVSPSALYYWETGKRSPRLESVRKVARALGVRADTLLTL
jgi:transcriptional regulator with XRE-family HTH domain